MFRPVRLILLGMLAFLAGVMFERSNARERCVSAQGDWSGGLCVMAGGQSD